MTITSHFEGRVRIRDERLREDKLATEIKEALLSSPGVAQVESNPRVGSLLVFYSVAATGIEQILKKIAELIGSEMEDAAARVKRTTSKIMEAVPAKIKKNVVNFGMLASLLLSVAAAAIDLKKLHIFTGVIFLAFFGFHFFERKDWIFA